MPIGRYKGTTPEELVREINKLRARGQGSGETSAKQIQKEIETAVNYLLYTTTAGDRLLAQDERQKTYAIRAGGAPNYMGEARAAVAEAKRAWQKALSSTKAERKEAILAAVEAVKHAKEVAPGKLALAFQDGFVCVYMSSTTADYINIIAAGSKGKWVWARGWAAPGHPSYLQLNSIPPERIIDDQPVQSSWVAHAWLLMD
jgi:hypothetical protein